MKRIDRQFRLARLWSNRELRRIAPMCDGIVANVSAGDDVDKEGQHYRDYFSSADEYWMTNYADRDYRGFKNRPHELTLDLTVPLHEELLSRFDVVFNHTTLEHVFDVLTAFRNLCLMSRDLVILVVPFCQVQHENEGYEDYWRFTPTCLRELFRTNQLSVVYESANNDFNAAVYIIMIASKNPAKWSSKMPAWTPLEKVASWVGSEPLSWHEIFCAIKRRLSKHE